MTLTTQLTAYSDCNELFERAVADGRGVRACYVTYEKARHMANRMHQCRALLRQESARIYTKGDPRWGKSEFDPYICRVIEDEAKEWWVYVEKVELNAVAVEGLSEDRA